MEFKIDRYGFMKRLEEKGIIGDVEELMKYIREKETKKGFWKNSETTEKVMQKKA